MFYLQNPLKTSFKKSSALLLATTLLTCRLFGFETPYQEDNDILEFESSFFEDDDAFEFETVFLEESDIVGFETPTQQNKNICGKAPHPMRVTARHIDPQGIGYHQGYTTLEGFFGLPQCLDTLWVPFFDVRGHVFNDGHLAANAGVGLRYLGVKRVWGGNVYYDYRNTHRQHYNQVGFGLENLGRVWDFRINGYFPVGTTKTPYYHTKFHEFKKHYAILERKHQFAMKGFDAEAGTHVKIGNKPWYFAEGIYYLENQGKATWGGKARFSIDILDYLKIEGNTSYDHIFKWIGQGQISVTAPFGHRRSIKAKSQRSCSRDVALVNRAFQAVARHEIIPVDTRHVYRKAIDPTTNSPYVFYFVDNTSHSKGTFESPFSTLLAAQVASRPNNVIYVFPGNGTTSNMNQGIILQDNQRLWGSGIAQSLPTTLGMIYIPAQTSKNPQMTNTSGNGVTLASNSYNEINGLIIRGANGDGIIGNNMTGLNLLNTSVFGSTNIGIALTQTSGPSLLTFTKVNSSNNGSDGLNIQSQNAADVTLAISQGTFIANGVSQTASGVLLASTDTSRISGTFQNSNFQNNPSAGMHLTSSSTTLLPISLNLYNNLFANNQLNGIHGDFSPGTATANVTLSKNIFSGHSNAGNRTANAACWLSFNGDNSSLTATNNEFSNNHQTGLILISNGNNNLNYTLNNNQINGNEGFGIYLSGSSLLGNIDATLSNNQINWNNSNAFYTSGNFGSATFNFTNNEYIGNCAQGLLFDGTYQGVVNQTLTESIISGNGARGIYFFGTFIHPFTSVIENNIITGNCDDGIVYQADFTFLNATINNNTLAQNGGLGLHFGSSGIILDLKCVAKNNQIFGNEEDGILIATNISDVTIEDCNINNNNGYGTRLILNPTGTQAKNITINGNSITNNKYDGIYALMAFDGFKNESTFTSSNNVVSCNSGNGISLTIMKSMGSGGTFASAINNNLVSYNTQNGIEIDLQSDDTTYNLPTSLIGNTINNNNLIGMTLLVEDQAVVNALIENNEFSYNLQQPAFQTSNRILSTASQCIVLENNVSDTGYLFDNSAGSTMTLVPVNASNVNIGSITTNGSVTYSNSCP